MRSPERVVCNVPPKKSRTKFAIHDRSVFLARVVHDTTSLSPGSELKIAGTLNGRPFDVKVENKKGVTEVKLEGLTFAGQEQATSFLAALRAQGVGEAKIRGLIGGRRVEARFKDNAGRTELKVEGATFASHDQIANLLDVFQDVSKLQIEGVVEGRRVEAHVDDGRVKLEGLAFTSQSQVDQLFASLQSRGFKEVKVEGLMDGRSVEARLKEGRLTGEVEGGEREPEYRPEGTDSGIKGDRAEDRDDSIRSGDRTERQRDQVERSKQPERPERAEKVERAERPERVERAERVERVERAERPERAERAERSGQRERVERAERRR